MYFDHKAYGERIKRLRTGRELTQEQLAEKINVSRTYMVKIENGLQIGPIEIAIELAMFFDVSMDFLLLGKENYRVDRKQCLRMAIDTLSISWRRQRIEYILKNEKYKGDAILQKSYTTESFPRKRKNNHGERNAYYMEDSHAAIVSDVDFETVQKIRAGHRRSTGITNTVLRGTLYCCCESPLRMRMSGQSVYWVCIRHSHNASACPITQIPEVQIQQAFLQLYYNLKHQGSHILPDLITNLQPIRERKFLWSVDVIELNKQIAELTSQNQLLTTLRESGCVDPDIFISKSNALTEQLRAAKQAKSRILNQDGDDTITGTQELLTILKRGPETLHDFDGELFGQLIDKVIIESNTSLRFRLKNGLELRESIERTVR